MTGSFVWPTSFLENETKKGFVQQLFIYLKLKKKEHQNSAAKKGYCFRFWAEITYYVFVPCLQAPLIFREVFKVVTKLFFVVK